MVLLDNVMPGKKGSDIAGELREDPATGDFPVIMVSGKGEFIYSFRRDQFQWKPNRPIVKDRGEIPEGHNVHELAQAFGTDDYISKPFSTAILIEVIRDVVKRHRKKKQHQEEAGGGGPETDLNRFLFWPGTRRGNRRPVPIRPLSAGSRPRSP